MRPRPCVAMNVIASGVTNCAAIVRSPSFSRSASSTTTTNRPARISSIASSIVAKGDDVAGVLVSVATPRIVALTARMSRSTYFASTSASRFTAWPGRSEDRVVASSVCGTSATAKASELSSATVSETPSTVIEPFSTQ